VPRCAQQLEPVEQEIKAGLARGPLLHQDETGRSISGARHWMHGSSTEQLTHDAVHAKRGKEALNALGILTDFHGVSGHDGWQSSWLYPGPHALWNVHHLRELLFLEQEQQQVWAGERKELLLDINAAVEQARAQGRSCRDPLEVADWKAQDAALLQAGSQANAPDPPAPGTKKGRRKQSAARNLLDRLSFQQDALLARRPGLLPHSRLSLDLAQARHGGPDCLGTGFARPSSFTCFLAHPNGYEIFTATA
jgi:transposase